MKFTLTIHCDNSEAFGSGSVADLSTEVAHILRDAADRIERYHPSALVLTDSAGQLAGHAVFDEDGLGNVRSIKETN